MKISKLKYLTLFIVSILTMCYAQFSFGAISPEEAAKLGTTLTGVGAEKAGNREGTIPPYAGGLTKPPANFKPGSGVRPDPFAAERPLFSINAQNMSQYVDKLTEGTKALMKKYPTYRIDVYKTHRTAAFPDSVIKNTAKNAVTAKTANNGISLRDSRAGYPFPIPKNGYEAMWNHLVRYSGRSNEGRVSNWVMDSSGKLTNTSKFQWWEEYPYYDSDKSRSDADLFEKQRAIWVAPPRMAGQGSMLFDAVNAYEKQRVAFMYLPGQRRVKLAPEIGYDTPDSSTAGANVFDEVYVFNGSMDRYDMKLIGKKEMYVPYNCYKAAYEAKSEELFKPKHLNPDLLRWELHRVWVVEATLKPGKRHIYPKRRFYLDEDSWAALAGDNYDAQGFLVTINYMHLSPCYDMLVPSTRFCMTYNTIGNFYAIDFWLGEGGFHRQAKVRLERDWSPASMAGAGIR